MAGMLIGDFIGWLQEEEIFTRRVYGIIIQNLIDSDDWEENLRNASRFVITWQMATSILTDIDHRSTRTTVQSTFFFGAAYAGAKLAYSAGKSVGHALTGSNLVGLVTGTSFGFMGMFVAGIVMHNLAESISDRWFYDVEQQTCELCNHEFSHRRFQYGTEYKCWYCRTWERDRRRFFVNAVQAAIVW